MHCNRSWRKAQKTRDGERKHEWNKTLRFTLTLKTFSFNFFSRVFPFQIDEVSLIHNIVSTVNEHSCRTGRKRDREKKGENINKNKKHTTCRDGKWNSNNCNILKWNEGKTHTQEQQRQRQPPVNTHKLCNVQQMQCALCARFAIIISCAH